MEWGERVAGIRSTLYNSQMQRHAKLISES